MTCLGPHEPCKLTDLREALTLFAFPDGSTQSQAHIKPLHWYIACRLCLEGGFDPDQITPASSGDSRNE